MNPANAEFEKLTPEHKAMAAIEIFFIVISKIIKIALMRCGLVELGVSYYPLFPHS